MTTDRKEYYRLQKQKKRAESRIVDKSVDIVDKSESVDKVEMSTNVHTKSTVDSDKFEKVPSAIPGLFTLKPIEVELVDSDWRPSEVARHDIKQDIFVSCGVPTKAKDGNEYVLIAGSLDVNLDGEIEPFTVVTAHDWREGVERTCMHGLHGWSCKEC